MAMWFNARSFTAASLVLAASAAISWGQTGGDSPLSGPAVEDRNTPGAANTFGETMTGERSKQGARVPPRVYFGLLREMGEDGAPEEVRPTEEQRGEIRAIVEEFQAAARAFRDEHKEELERLRDAAGEPRRPGGGAPGRGRGAERGADAPPPPEDAPGGPPANEAQRAARERLRELMAQGPKPDEYYARIWALLSEPQQEYVRAGLEAHQAERMREREGPIAKEQVRKQFEQADPRLKELQGLSREEIRAKLQSLPADERERLMQQWRGRRGGKGEGKSRPQVEEKPAPEMDDVDVPSP